MLLTANTLKWTIRTSLPRRGLRKGNFRIEDLVQAAPQPLLERLGITGEILYLLRLPPFDTVVDRWVERIGEKGTDVINARLYRLSFVLGEMGVHPAIHEYLHHGFRTIFLLLVE